MSSYCTSQDIVDRISSSGQTLRLDDFTAGANRDALIARIIENASAQVDLYLLPRYDAAVLAANTWVIHATADLALCILCRRRGNPPPGPIKEQCDAVLETMKEIKDGELALPEAPERKESVPVMSNVRVRLDPFPRTVVERSRSTGNPQGYPQNTDNLDYPPRY